MVAVKSKILEYIRKRGRGKFVFPSDLTAIGNTNAVKEALSTLAQENTLIRLGHGIYYYPKYDPELGVLYPGLDEVAHAIARRDKVLITPTSDFALNYLGLSEQVPLNTVYLSSGRSKEIKIGSNKIFFKQISSRRSKAGRNYIGLIVRALEGIGPTNLTPQTLQPFYEKMKDLPEAEINATAKLTPHWISNILTDFVKQRYGQLVNPN